MKGRLANNPWRPERWVYPLGLALILICLFPSGPPVGMAQVDDLSIPGLTDNLAPDPGSEAQASTAGKSLLGMIGKGGWSMWILGALSIALIGIAAYLAMDLQAKAFRPEPLKKELIAEMKAGNFEAVLEKASADKSTLGVMVSAMAHQVQETGYGTEDNDLLNDLMAEAAQKTNRGRARMINYFSIIAQASPMVGLLGTVSGMIKAFGTLGETKMDDPAKLANSISEALITTASGLVIALPAMFLYHFFRDRLEELILECEDIGADLLKRLRRAAFAAAEEAESEPLQQEETVS